jgi:hypothetical protein
MPQINAKYTNDISPVSDGDSPPNAERNVSISAPPPSHDLQLNIRMEDSVKDPIQRTNSKMSSESNGNATGRELAEGNNSHNFKDSLTLN